MEKAKVAQMRHDQRLAAVLKQQMDVKHIDYVKIRNQAGVGVEEMVRFMDSAQSTNTILLYLTGKALGFDSWADFAEAATAEEMV